MSETMRFKNPTQHVILLDAIGLDPVAPGGTVDVPIELCAPGRGDNGKRSKSSLENVAPQLMPFAEEDATAWKATPAVPAPVSRIVSIAGRRPTEAPGVKALREQREQAIKKAQEAKASSETKSVAPDDKVQG